MVTSAVGHDVDVSPDVRDVDAMHPGDVFAGDRDRLGHVGIRNVDLDVQVRDVLDAGVVGVVDEGLHGHDRVHRRDEAAVAQPHRVQPLHDLEVKEVSRLPD